MDATNAAVISIAGVVVIMLLLPVLFRLYMSYAGWIWECFERLDKLIARKNKH